MPGNLPPSLYPRLDPDCPLQTLGPLVRAKIIKSYVHLSVILWYPNLQVSSVQFTILFIGLFIKYSIPQNIHSVSNPCNISLGCVFW